LERKDTLYGVDIGDPVLDPKSPEFNPYKWFRMYVQFLLFGVGCCGIDELIASVG
jgi:hypothetical protein